MANEDVEALEEMLRRRLMTPQFAASVLMIDFQNPIFSPVRREFLDRYRKRLGGMDDVPRRFAALVAEAAGQQQPDCEPRSLSLCTAEQQFLHFYELDEQDWKPEMNERIREYLEAVGQRVQSDEGVNDYMRLAVSRRQQLERQPFGELSEFSLLFPAHDLGALDCRMLVDGTVRARGGGKCRS